MICDYVRWVGGVLQVKISKELMLSVSSARQRYHRYLEVQRQKRKIVEETLKSAEEEVREIKKKKLLAEKDYQELNKTADELAVQAEETGELTLLSKSNALRKAAKDKMVKIKNFDDDLKKMSSLKSN